jgi:hypothetical protein
MLEKNFVVCSKKNNLIIIIEIRYFKIELESLATDSANFPNRTVKSSWIGIFILSSHERYQPFFARHLRLLKCEINKVDEQSK